MAKIRILPEQLANQIAAGEVVERPASVVKELLENSLDAGATRVEIEIEGGGTRLIRIIDNGCGMDGDDLLLSLERHGTSKLIQAEDLGAIRTLGFRGEAIPSIGSVSHLSITSRPANQPLGTRVSLHYGKLVETQEMGSSYGTTSEVRHLFGNTPARRKFLRSTRTELGHIEEVVRNYCLCTPGVTFILRVDNRVILSFDHLQSIEQRLAVIINYSGPFLRISGKNKELPDHLAEGFLLPPATITSGSTKLRLFVNGRMVRDRLMVHAVTEGMRNFLLKGHQPAGLLHLRLPPSMVDVNVHPAKHEVRFRNGKEVHEFIVQAVAKALIDHQQQLKLAMFSRDHGIAPSIIPLDPLTSGEELSFSSTDLARVLDMAQTGEQEKRNEAMPE
jgi:DNA mismatch repair protein MutL